MEIKYITAEPCRYQDLELGGVLSPPNRVGPRCFRSVSVYDAQGRFFIFALNPSIGG